MRTDTPGLFRPSGGADGEERPSTLQLRQPENPNCRRTFYLLLGSIGRAWHLRLGVADTIRQSPAEGRPRAQKERIRRRSLALLVKKEAAEISTENGVLPSSEPLPLPSTRGTGRREVPSKGGQKLS